VGSRVGLDNAEKTKFFTLPGLEFRPLGRPARSQSLYRLSYPGSYLKAVEIQYIYSSVDEPEVVLVSERNDAGLKELSSSV
jgi:hypothetical protein